MSTLVVIRPNIYISINLYKQILFQVTDNYMFTSKEYQ